MTEIDVLIYEFSVSDTNNYEYIIRIFVPIRNS